MQLAKQLGLNELNEVDFHEPYMKKSTSIPGDLPLDNEVIEKFVRENKRATLRKLRPMDMYDTWVRSLYYFNYFESHEYFLKVICALK